MGTVRFRTRPWRLASELDAFDEVTALSVFMRIRGARSVAAAVGGLVFIIAVVGGLVLTLPPLGAPTPRQPLERLASLGSWVLAPLTAGALAIIVYRLIIAHGTRRLLSELACERCGAVVAGLLHAFGPAECPACGVAAEPGRCGPPTAVLRSRALAAQNAPLKVRYGWMRRDRGPRWRTWAMRALVLGSAAAVLVGGVWWVLTGRDAAGGVLMLGVIVLCMPGLILFANRGFYAAWLILADEYDRSVRERLGAAVGLDTGSMMVLGYTARWVELGVLTPELLAAQVAEFERGEDRNTEHYRYGALMAFYGTREAFSDAEVESLCAILSEDPDPTMARAGLVALTHMVRLTDGQFERVLASDLLRSPRSSGAGPRRAIERNRLLAQVDVHGWTPEFVAKALADGDGMVHRELLAWEAIDRATLESLAEKGANKAVRNMARRRLGRR